MRTGWERETRQQGKLSEAKRCKEAAVEEVFGVWKSAGAGAQSHVGGTTAGRVERMSGEQPSGSA